MYAYLIGPILHNSANLSVHVHRNAMPLQYSMLVTGATVKGLKQVCQGMCKPSTVHLEVLVLAVGGGLSFYPMFRWYLHRGVAQAQA